MMMRKIAIFVFLLSFLVAFIEAQNATKTDDVKPASPDEEKQWKLFKSMHQKKYKNTIREAKRKAAFLANLRSVRQKNAAGMADDDITHSFRINKFADWTKDELANLHGEIDIDQEIPGPEMDSRMMRMPVPDSLDLRNSSCMPPVKFQGECGSCYTFAATATVEYGKCMKTGTLTLLSEENLVDCSQKYGNAGCSGGLALKSYNYIKDFGIASSDSYPYAGEESECYYSSQNVGANVTGWAYATSTRDEEAMKVAVANYGPLAVSVDAGGWPFYSGGVYSDPQCSTSTNHAVVIVGYGTDLESKKPYWIIRNSWGPNWGLNGYIYLERGVNRCGVAKRVVYPIAN